MFALFRGVHVSVKRNIYTFDDRKSKIADFSYFELKSILLPLF